MYSAFGTENALISPRSRGTGSDWINKTKNIDLSWKKNVLNLLNSFTERTPGSFLEVKDSCLTWHYRDADPDFGIGQVIFLIYIVVYMNRSTKRMIIVLKQTMNINFHLQAKNLQLHLDQMLGSQPVRVITAPNKKYMVLHPARVNKGR